MTKTAFKTVGRRFKFRKGGIWNQLPFRHWAINYMTLPNNRSTLGSNKTGVWTVSHQNVKNAERRRKTQITNNKLFTFGSLSKKAGGLEY
jgi:hypothetical protein